MNKNTKPTKQVKEVDEELKRNLEAIFKYARLFVVNQKNDEEELMAIIQVKRQTFERLFEKDLPPTK
tara:strand:- start:573 stop:773 length:201 start_codon:yes stop_codon:yes gene_type:complete